MPLIKLPAANTWNLATGLEAIDNAIRLEVGGGLTPNANSLDMTALPSAPWSDNGTEAANIRDGEILEILDDIINNNRFFQLTPADWNESLNTGVSFHVKARATVNGGGANASLFFEDGTKRFHIEFMPTGILSQPGVGTYDIAKYQWAELFISIDSNLVDFWIWNTITQTWDVVGTGVATTAAGADRLFFGSTSTPQFGRSFWDFLIWFTGASSTPFLSTSPVAEMASALTIGVNIDQIDLAETTATGADIKYQHDTGSGYNGSWITLAALQAALVDTSPATLRLKAQFNTNGLAFGSLSLDGTLSVVGATGGAVCDYADASDLRLGVEQDFGNITGTAAIPAKPDTREGTAVDDGVGTLAVAPANDVRLGVPTDDTVGNYVPAEEGNHALGDSYGSLGTEFTGTKALTPFKLPVEVVLEDEENLVFEGCE